MSDDQLYELARKRIDRRNRRWLLWGANLVAWLIFIALISITNSPIPEDLGKFIAIAWGGLFMLHGITLGVTQNRDQQVEKEVERLRLAVYDEKPKRLELGEDGELIDDDAYEYLSADKRRQDSV